MVKQSAHFRIEQLNTSFGSKVIHRDLCLEIQRGEILALLGGSGSGKSVLLRSLIGLEIPASGTWLFEGRDLFKQAEKEWIASRKEIAYAFQSGALFDSLSVFENIAFPMIAHLKLKPVQIQERVTGLLELISLPDAGNLKPNEISGGMQKRVGLARSIALDPKLILYDEPTAGLDPYNSLKIMEILLTLKKQHKTSILVTHDVPCALKVADRIAFLLEGKIMALQTIDEVRTSPDPYIERYIKGESP